MIKRIKLCVNHNRRIHNGKINLEKRIEFFFNPGYNVVIGPNQSGKSTLLESLANCNYCEIEKTSDTKIKFLSTETLNPLMIKTFKSREEMIMHTRALFSSHGEIVQELLGSQRYFKENCIIIDTPDTGQDIKGNYTIQEGFKKMTDKGIQIITATHNPLFLQNADKIIEFERDYLKKLLEYQKKQINIRKYFYLKIFKK